MCPMGFRKVSEASGGILTDRGMSITVYIDDMLVLCDNLLQVEEHLEALCN